MRLDGGSKVENAALDPLTNVFLVGPVRRNVNRQSFGTQETRWLGFGSLGHLGQLSAQAAWAE